MICLCYNQASYVLEAIFSVLDQTYNNLEILIVDDGSTDQSAEIINKLIVQYPYVIFIQNKYSIGNCTSFNNAYKICKGDLIIDFAADDVMLPDRIALQVEAFAELDQIFGVIYSNAQYIGENGINLGLHSAMYTYQPSGNIYVDLLKKYFICPPTMMYRRWILDELNGYNENLAYEDFDFWVRSSRICKYQYIDSITTKKRIVKSSLGARFLEKNNPINYSTYEVCQIAYHLNKTIEENEALAQRILLEIKLSYLTENFELVDRYVKLYQKLPAQSKTQAIQIILYEFLARRKIGVSWWYKLKQKLSVSY